MPPLCGRWLWARKKGREQSSLAEEELSEIDLGGAFEGCVGVHQKRRGRVLQGGGAEGASDRGMEDTQRLWTAERGLAGPGKAVK